MAPQERCTLSELDPRPPTLIASLDWQRYRLHSCRLATPNSLVSAAVPLHWKASVTIAVKGKPGRMPPIRRDSE